ncbi:hypothetical protein C8J57DRAFT_1718855 [Mycena rebaudengoi]|nr:hypothetical protein C8J57DRAFT_1718855 [Mycena rebaudengoi]
MRGERGNWALYKSCTHLPAGVLRRTRTRRHTRRSKSKSRGSAGDEERKQHAGEEPLVFTAGTLRHAQSPRRTQDAGVPAQHNCARRAQHKRFGERARSTLRTRLAEHVPVPTRLACSAQSTLREARRGRPICMKNARWPPIGVRPRRRRRLRAHVNSVAHIPVRRLMHVLHTSRHPVVHVANVRDVHVRRSPTRHAAQSAQKHLPNEAAHDDRLGSKAKAQARRVEPPASIHNRRSLQLADHVGYAHVDSVVHIPIRRSATTRAAEGTNALA